MPRKRIGIIPYQPAYFHIISPNADELADGYQEFAAAAYDQYRNTCFKYGPEFCQLAELDDTLHLQWKASDATNNLFTFSDLEGNSGSATGTIVNKLVDAAASFTAANDLDRIVVNTTTGQYCRITAIDSPVQVVLSADIFTSGDAYQIYDIDINVDDFAFDASTGELTLTGQGAAIIQIGQTSGIFPPSTGVNWGTVFRAELGITQYNLGSAIIDTTFGSGSFEITSAGDYELFFYNVTTSSALQITTGNNFFGTFDLGNMELYGVNERYRIDVLDLNDSIINYVDINLTGIAAVFLTYGNGFYSNAWRNLLTGTGCECVRLAISDWDGNNCASFTELTDWTIEDETIFQEGDQICFSGTAKDGFATVVFSDLPCGVSSFPLAVEFELEIVSYTSGGVYVSINNALGTGSSLSGSYSAVGTYQFTVNTPSPDGVSKQIQLNASTSDTVLCARLKYRLVEAEPTYFAKSECFNVCEQHDCSLLLDYTNKEPAYGLIISEAGTIPNFNVRVNGYKRDGVITDVELINFKTGGTTQIPAYFNGQKNYTLALAPMPPYMHQILSVALTMSDCLLDGVRVHRIGEYTPDFSEDSEVAKVDIDITQRNQKYLRNSF